MLARRFTIICLVMTLSGMFVATLVAKVSAPVRTWETVRAVP